MKYTAKVTTMKASPKHSQTSLSKGLRNTSISAISTLTCTRFDGIHPHGNSKQNGKILKAVVLCHHIKNVYLTFWFLVVYHQ